MDCIPLSCTRTCVSVVVCGARELRPCLSYSRRRGRVDLGLFRSLEGGGGFPNTQTSGYTRKYQPAHLLGLYCPAPPPPPGPAAVLCTFADPRLRPATDAHMLSALRRDRPGDAVLMDGGMCSVSGVYGVCAQCRVGPCGTSDEHPPPPPPGAASLTVGRLSDSGLFVLRRGLRVCGRLFGGVWLCGDVGVGVCGCLGGRWPEFRLTTQHLRGGGGG